MKLLTRQVSVSVYCHTDRLGFIGKENDAESGLGDFGVRKYDDAAGRFLDYQVTNV